MRAVQTLRLARPAQAVRSPCPPWPEQEVETLEAIGFLDPLASKPATARAEWTDVFLLLLLSAVPTNAATGAAAPGPARAKIPPRRRPKTQLRDICRVPCTTAADQYRAPPTTPGSGDLMARRLSTKFQTLRHRLCRGSPLLNMRCGSGIAMALLLVLPGVERRRILRSQPCQPR
jgi:hypothetical protein